MMPALTSISTNAVVAIVDVQNFCAPAACAHVRE
jgi:hypothetical protein